MKNIDYLFIITCLLIALFSPLSCSPKKQDNRTTREEKHESGDIEKNQIPDDNARGEEWKNQIIESRDKEDRGKKEDQEFFDPAEKGLEDQNRSKTDEKQKMLEMKELDEPVEGASYTGGSQKYLSLLPLIPVSPLYPEDFRIGSLHKKAESSADAIAVGNRISGFFLTFKKGEIDRSFLYGENIGPELYRLLMYHIEQEHIPRDFRIGAVTINNKDTAYTKVRLFGNKGETEGEVYLKKEENEWFISDIQINFYELEIPTEKRKEEFMPTTYRWLYEGM